MIETISSAGVGFPDGERILSLATGALASALSSTEDSGDASEPVLPVLLQAGAPSILTSAIKAVPKLHRFSCAALDLLTRIIDDEATAVALSSQEGGAVEACAAVLRANPTSSSATISAVSAMLSLSETDACAINVAKLGGTRQIIATINAGVTSLAFVPALERSLALLSRVANITEGAELLVRQGAIDAIIEAASSLMRFGEGTAIADETLDGLMKVLGRLITKTEVLKTIASVRGLMEETAAGEPLTGERLRAALIKLPIITSLPQFSDLVQKAGIEDAVGSILTTLVGRDADPAVARVGLPYVFRTLAALSKNSRLKDAPLLLKATNVAIRNDIAVTDALDFIKASARFSSDIALQLCRDSTLALVVEKLQANIIDKPVSAACFRSLAALGSHSNTTALLAATPALSIAREWLSENTEDATEESVAAALSVVGALAGDRDRGDALVSEGLLDAVNAVLDKRCGDGSTPAPQILGASVNVLKAVALINARTAAQLSASNSLSRIVRAMKSAENYTKNENAVVAACDFFVAAAQSCIQNVDELNETGALDVILAGMSANSTSERVLAAGGAALEAMGAGEEAARLALEEVRALNARLADTRSSGGDLAAFRSSEEALALLSEAVQRLSNLTVVRGVVTATTAAGLVAASTEALELIIESPTAEPASIAAALTAVGRVIDIGGPATDEHSVRSVEAIISSLNCRRGANLIVRTAALHALGQVVASRPAVTKLLHEGGIALINTTAKKHAKDAKLQNVAAAAIKKITAASTQFAANELDTAEGRAALAALLNASAGDPEALAGILAKIIGSRGGVDALLHIIADGLLADDVIGETLSAIASATLGDRALGSLGRVRALINALENASLKQATITNKSSGGARLRAAKITDATLSLLAQTDFDSEGAEKFIRSGGIDKLMELLKISMDDEVTVGKIMAVLKGLTKPALPADLAPAFAPHMRLINEALRRGAKMADVGIPADAMEAIAGIANLTPEGDRASWDKESIRHAAALSRLHPANTRVMGALRLLELALGRKIADADAAARAFAANLTVLIKTIPPVGKMQEVPSAEDPSRAYYFDPDSNATTWVAPPAFVAFKNALAAAGLSGAAITEDMDVKPIDGASMGLLIGMLQSQIRSPAACTAIVSLLGALSLNEDNVNLLNDLDGILAMIAAANAHPSNLELLRVVLVLMERISRLGRFREIMAEKGGVDLLTKVAIFMHVALEDICLLALMTISNLAVDSSSNITLMMSKNVVKAVELALQTYENTPRILQEAMSVLSNLMYGSDENKLIIGQTCGDEIVGVVRNFPSESAMIKQALRALGNLSFCDENIRFICEEHHATKAIVATMRANTNVRDEEVQELAMDCLTNFASINEGPPERNSDGEIIHTRASVPGIVLREAGCAQTINNLKTWRSNPRILLTALSALANLSTDPEVAETMCGRQNLLTILFELMGVYALDAEMMNKALEVLSSLTLAREVLTLVVDMDGISLVMSAIDQHSSDSVLLKTATSVLTHISSSEDGREAILRGDVLPMLFALLEEFLERPAYRDFAIETLKTMRNLCADEVMSSTIAEQGMHIIVSLLQQYEEDADFLTGAFKLLGHLAFVESNLAIIVQYNGIQRLIKAITLHPDSRLLMLSSIQTLDNISMKNREYATIVIDEGGKELIETIMTTYAGDAELLRYGKSALLALSALEGLQKSAEITAKAARAKKRGDEGERAVDPLGEFRNLLAAGRVFKVWTKGAPKAAHVVMSSDFKSIVWQEVGSQRKLGALELRAVTGVRAGAGTDGHKRALLSMVKAVDNALAFSVVGDRNSLDLEASSAKEQEQWVKAFEKLLAVFRTNPAALTQN